MIRKKVLSGFGFFWRACSRTSLMAIVQHPRKMSKRSIILWLISFGSKKGRVTAGITSTMVLVIISSQRFHFNPKITMEAMLKIITRVIRLIFSIVTFIFISKHVKKLFSL